MKKGWLINLSLLLMVVGIALFLHLRPQEDTQTKKHEVSDLKLAEFDAIKVDFPAQAGSQFVKKDGYWMMNKPYSARADQQSVLRILAIIAATTSTKLPLTDPSKFGLDQPALRLTLSGAKGEHVFSFGTHNPVTEQQYVGYNQHVFLLGVEYSEAAATQAIEMVDKTPLKPSERKQVSGFEFGHLEQWEANALKVSLDAQGQWKANDPKAKPTQNEMNEWLDFSWLQSQAKSVEIYVPDHKVTYPSFEVVLKDGKKIHFDKMQESPEYLLARPDEGLIYHYANDVGFTMVNPPVNIK